MVSLIKKTISKIILNFRPFATSSVKSNPVVTVREGKLRGAVQHLTDGSKYYSFKGIPYATPPVGKLRFKAPLPPKPWNGILNALEHGPVCPQKRYLAKGIIEGSENCLFLNVYTRTLEPNSKIPVIVTIHGGGFLSGSGDSNFYGPEFLLQHNVIVVTINYRLEVLGFLCLDIPEVPGNAGLKDQTAALKWVQNNIAQFGGDEENVTIVGDSAGGASVTYHMVSSMSKGLFQKGITQSGVFTAEWTFRTDAQERAFRLGRYLGKDTNDPYDLLEYLQSVPPNKLTGVTDKVLIYDEKYRNNSILFTPVAEKKFSNTESFINENPIDLLVAGRIQKIPLILGYNSAEYIPFIKTELQKLGVKKKLPMYCVQKKITHVLSREKVVEYGDRIIKFYLGDKEINPDNVDLPGKMATDSDMVYSCHSFANFFVEFCEHLYMYRFNLDTELNIMKIKSNFQNIIGASHGDELFYIYKNEMNSEIYEKQRKLRNHVDMVTKFWTDFAKTGNPTPDSSSFQWRPYTKLNDEYLRIEEQLSMGNDDEKERIDFWNELYFETGLPAIDKRQSEKAHSRCDIRAQSKV